MISRQNFRDIAKTQRIVPVWKKLVADMATPIAAFSRIVGQGSGFLLESVEDNESWSRFSFIGRQPLAELVAHKNEISVKCFVEGQEESFSELPTNDGILAALEKLFETYSASKIPELEVPFWGGVAGYLGYDTVREIERIPDTAIDDRNIPDAIMEVIGQLVVFDHWKQQAILIDNVLLPPKASKADIDAAYDLGMENLTELSQAGTHGYYEPLFEVPNTQDINEKDFAEFKRSIPAKDYETGVEVVKEYVKQGDIIQAVLSERFEVDLGADPFDVYRVLRQINPSPYMFFLRYDDTTILGASPEALVKVSDGRVISRPIAGTRPRGASKIEDSRLGAELIEDPKEKAEHIMLVDLARNDVGKVVQYGSLEVESLMALEKFSHVMHMTSQVAGDLNPDLNSLDVLRATFPAGTISGAPKIRAMEIIDELEPVRRGPYSGMVGYLDFSGNLDSAIAIRTLVCKKEKAWIQAGAGITLDSVPEKEEQECQHKMKALVSAILNARKMSATRESSQ